MIQEIHNPSEILANNKFKFYQIWLELDNGNIGTWTGNGFYYLNEGGFFESKVIQPTELVADYGKALSAANTFARQFNDSGVITISGVPSYS